MSLSDVYDEGECLERRRAELEFVAAAYDPETEAWQDFNPTVAGETVVHRRLDLYEKNTLQVELTLTMPPTYPMGPEPLRISAAIVCETAVPREIRKAALDAISSLEKVAQKVANENAGSEAIFLVFARAEEWVTDDGDGSWQAALKHAAQLKEIEHRERVDHAPRATLFGRRLIYSHHIISKVKRADIKQLASEHQLTGYMKVGWPGLIIIEGREQDCVEFYDAIRRWNWQYLVIRGEEQDDLDAILGQDENSTIRDNRKFSTFLEVDDMSVVAQHCKDAGLESLFRTSMKQYDNTVNTNATSDSESGTLHGALIHVDHMNDPKGYRKWLQKTAKETSCQLLLKQVYPNEDYSKRPRIFVGIVGHSSDVSNFLKRWRTSRVDVDSRGKPCLERMMTVLMQCLVPPHASEVIDSEQEETITTTEAQLLRILNSIGGQTWKNAYQSVS